MKKAFKKAVGIILPSKPSLYHYKEQPLATSPGAGNYAFLPATSLPLEDVNGAGYGYRRQWGMPQAQLYYGQEQVANGLEGITAPGIQTTPLIDMDAYLDELSALNAETFESA